MPIIPESVRETKEDFGGEKNYRADFLDPVSNEKLPMEVAIFGSPSVRSVGGRIRESDSYDNRTDAFAVDQGDEGSLNITNVDTLPAYQRRGYASSLYDLIAYALANMKTPLKLKPGMHQGDEAKAMWEKYAPDGTWDSRRAKGEME